MNEQRFYLQTSRLKKVKYFYYIKDLLNAPRFLQSQTKSSPNMLSNQIKNQHLMWRAGFGPAADQLNQLKDITPTQLYKADTREYS